MLYLIGGRRETGKTTLGVFLIDRSPVRIYFDPRGLIPVADGMMRAETIEECVTAFDRIHESRAGALVIVPRRDVQELFDHCAKEIAAYLTSAEGGHVGWLIDEFRFLRETDGEDFQWIVRCVTRTQANIVITAHRPTDIPTDLRAIADVWCLFATTQEHDLKTIAARCGSGVAGQVANLPARVFIKWDDTRAKDTKYADPSAWYRPLVGAGSKANATADPTDTLSGKSRDLDTLF